MRPRFTSSLHLDRPLWWEQMAMQMNATFLGRSAVFAPRQSVRPRTSAVPRAEKASTAGTWLPGVDSPSWLEEAALPGNRGMCAIFLS